LAGLVTLDGGVPKVWVYVLTALQAMKNIEHNKEKIVR